MRRGDEVLIERLGHVLIHLVVFRVEDVSGGTPHVTRKTCAGTKPAYISHHHRQKKTVTTLQTLRQE